MVFIVLCIVCLILFLYVQYLRIKMQYWRKKGIASEDPIPIFGNILNTLLMKESLGETLRNIYNKHNAPYVGFHMFDEPSLVLRDPKIIKNVMVKDFNNFTDRCIVAEESVDPISAHILFSSRSPVWGELRRKVTPIFTSGKLKNMYELIYENSNDLVKYLEDNSKIIEVRDVFAKFTTDVISSTCFGINANSFTDPNAEFRKVSARLFDWSSLEVTLRVFLYLCCPSLVKLFKISFFDRYCLRFLKDAFWRTILLREASNSKKNDFVDLLLGIKNDTKIQKVPLDNNMILAQAIQFFAAGFETTSSTIGYCLYELAKNQEIQKKLKKEVKETFAKNQHIPYDELKDMKYLDMVIAETLRKYPVVPFLERRCNKDYKVPDSDFIIEKNTRIYISPLALHHDTAYFENPDKFVPERFEMSPIPFTYLPFGEGPRNCIGARFGQITTKLAIARALNEFTFEFCSQTPQPIEINKRGALLAPSSGLYLKVSKDV